MRKIVGMLVGLFFMLGLVSQAAAPVPRVAPELKMTEPSEKQTVDRLVVLQRETQRPVLQCDQGIEIGIGSHNIVS